MTGRTLLALAVAVLLLPTMAAAAGEEELVAKVNGLGISKAQFDRNWKSFIAQRGIPPDHAEKTGKINEFRLELVNRLIDNELLWQEAKKKHLADDKAVSEEVSRIQKQYPSPEAYQQALKDNGLNEESIKDFILHRLAIQKFVEAEVGKGLDASDKDVHDYYMANIDKFQEPEQVRARHILVKVDAKADPAAKDAARKKVDDLLKEAKGGADFAELAKKNSDCPSSQNGGDLGFFPRGQMVKPFEDAAFALKPGEVSGVVETQFGFHVIKLEERKEASTVPEEELAPRIKDYLKAAKTSQALQDKIKDLRNSAKIEILIK